jgi:8-oxo-dGTP pyrophosphatase MutT (NUDIX family)
MQAQKALLSGRWDENQSWELYQSAKIPDPALCTAVYCLAILPNTKQVVLTRNHRGWEMLGGHIELGETVEQALLRECLEEGGFTPEHYQLFGYRKITAKQPVAHNQKEGGFYPFPHGYIPHFIAISTLPLQKPSGMEIIESRAFSLSELGTLKMEQWPILKSMLDLYGSGSSLLHHVRVGANNSSSELDA